MGARRGLGLAALPDDLALHQISPPRLVGRSALGHGGGRLLSGDLRVLVDRPRHAVRRVRRRRRCAAAGPVPALVHGLMSAGMGLAVLAMM
jgi:hypothetical protein